MKPRKSRQTDKLPRALHQLPKPETEDYLEGQRSALRVDKRQRRNKEPKAGMQPRPGRACTACSPGRQAGRKPG